jgi:hypothetical protein
MKYLFNILFICGLIFPAGLCADKNYDPTNMYVAYLMAYFGPEEKLFYAYSYDARHWTALNNGSPVFDAGARLRDPFINRARGQFHLVHTKGWDFPTIYHWESLDLIHWQGGPIDVVPPEKKRAWAPEFFYSEKDDQFYVYWASIHDGHNTMHMATTTDWTDLSPQKSSVYFDLGIHDIDLTIVKVDSVFYGFHKPGGVDDKMGNWLFVSKSLDSDSIEIGATSGKIVFPDESKPTEGPEVIKLFDQQKWYIYADPFHSPLEAWETINFVEFEQISVTTPNGAKHCSMLPITQIELDALLVAFPLKK